MQNNSPPISVPFDGKRSSDSLDSLPAHLRRKIAIRWEEWRGWVRMYLCRHNYDSATMAAEFARLRRRHSEHLLALIWAGIAMRQVRRHRLDDPRITDEVRAVLVRATFERRKKAWLARNRRISDPQARSLCAFDNPSIGAASSVADSLLRPGSSQIPRQGPEKTAAPMGQVTIDLIQRCVSKHFNLRELRDQNLKARTNRLVVAFPRQVAMYIARQLTMVSLQEIGRQFGGMHHTTVLHSIKKVADMRKSDKALDRIIIQLMNALVLRHVDE